MSCTNAVHLHLPSWYHLYIFVHHIIGHGEAAFDRVLRDPVLASEYMASWCLESGLFLWGFLHGERSMNPILSYQSRKRRMMSRQSQPDGMVAGGVTPGFLPVYYHFLEAQFPPRADDPTTAETFPYLDYPGRVCSGWRVDTDHMPLYSPGLQAVAAATQVANKKKQ
jgi:hypothetical protein